MRDENPLEELKSGDATEAQQAPLTKEAAAINFSKRWGEMSKEERAEYWKRNPRRLYLCFAGFFSAMALIFFGLAQIPERSAYSASDGSSRMLIWMCISLICASFSFWKAWRSPTSTP